MNRCQTDPGAFEVIGPVKTVKRREQLLREVWDMQGDSFETRTVDTHVKRLRTKLGAAGTYVETVRGIGYRFVDSPAS